MQVRREAAAAVGVGVVRPLRVSAQPPVEKPAQPGPCGRRATAVVHRTDRVVDGELGQLTPAAAEQTVTADIKLKKTRNLVTQLTSAEWLASWPGTDAEKRLGLELFYDEATAHAKSLRVEETTGSLRDLVGTGFKDFDRILGDPAWAKILAVPRFRKEFDAIRGEAKGP